MDLISLSIPAFFVLIGVEVFVAWRTGRPLYRFADSVSDLGCGIVNQVIAVFTAGALAGLYAATFHFARLNELSGATAWVVGIVGVDLGYYWFHRTAHERAAVWASHVVHHSSEEYNLSVALRQGAIEPWFTWIFYQPLALIGVPPAVFFTANSVNTLYQFWVHTRAIDRLGPLEWVLNTPSHHRVHHGTDPKYLDRNYGGMFVIWDRAFGTFQVEEEEPTYGLVEPLQTWNPIAANLEFPRQMLALTRGRSLGETLSLWWTAPADLPFPGKDGPVITAGREPFDTPSRPGANLYVGVQFALALVGLVGLLFGAASLSLAAQLSLGAWVIATMGLLTGLFEQKPWVLPAESLRLLALPAFGSALGPAGLVAGLGLAGASWLGLRRAMA